ncbi:aminodeoxychorismate synthase component I [Truepera radiovictrix]|uniref:Para-aminobenzoate synthase, subunit I n=1 Tax=Truepera radiovictrix (strain DSM 17093 / CIP 108686 / LMG 22925 / RQ-24) TaxID=649638 RepID=D7CSB2_TRURR|nr:aminodeoxychorismate synthase component I [Truepera radiovictrix]ADI13644.1 para-aminobenzoate synthase, subunit I [Truepera radiovictrix DSM 17093]WMT57795.1 aminodeoxychorismate synthase component I [Truepera radiovictrix]
MLVFDFSPGPRRVFGRPLEVIRADRLGEVAGAFAAVQRAVSGGLYAAGFVAYEAAPAFDEALRTHPPGPLPLVWFGLYEAPTGSAPLTARPPSRMGGWALDTSPEAYARAVAAIQGAIADGVTYQANYTVRLRGRVREPSSENLFALYEALRRVHAPPYASYLELGEAHLLSLSPELFFSVRGTRVTARPMKGTAARGRWLEEDEAQQRALLASPKERAENVMIVDLLRNDLGKLARPGGVRVPALLSLETYPTFHTLTSTVTADLPERPTLWALFRALFPCGSVTGAPKVSTMQLLRRLETTPRGVYCGAIGFVTPHGEMRFSVPIRTLVVTPDGRAEYGVGSGVTYDARAEAEYEELATKAAAITRPRPEVELLETLLWDGARYTLLARHLRRMETSARFFGVAFDARALQRALMAHAEAFRGERRRVRARLSHSGVAVESTPYAPPPERPPVALARTPIDPRDPFLYHKTTHREVYARHRRAFPDAFDVLLWNGRGELTEFTIGNLVVERRGERLTPPREAGLLAGTFRAELLEAGEITERPLFKHDLLDASRVWLVNSVHGWVEVQLQNAFRRSFGAAEAGAPP